MPSALTTPLLSICIPSLNQRADKLRHLCAQLAEQPRAKEVEILVSADDGHQPTGTKRNQLVALARGRFIAHVDDDDQVSSNYIGAILAAIESRPDIDVVLLRGRRTEAHGGVLEFDYRLGCKEGIYEDDVYWNIPGHLCPIRAELAKKVLFPAVTRGEDLPWNKAIAPLLHIAVRAGRDREVLYHYQWDSTKRPTISEQTQKTPAMTDHAHIFTPQYKHSSGPGSTHGVTKPYRRFLEDFIRKHAIRSILDLGCGDLKVMSHVDLHGAQYLGVDVINERVRKNAREHRKMSFVTGDARTYPIPAIDLVIMKDVLQHWNNHEVSAFLVRLLASPAKLALITNDNYDEPSYTPFRPNADCDSGTWRPLDLTAPPFSVGEVVFTWQCSRGDHIDTKNTVLIKIR